jgi:[ribosomal protein S5]-alanine N-acetyltransferase
MLSPNFSPFPELVTDRLILRQVRIEDAEALFSLRSDAALMKYIGRPIASSIDDAVKLIDVILDLQQKNDGITWAICLKETPQVLMGTVGYWRMQKEHYRAEIGYLLHGSLHGKGVMMEAIKSVLDFGFNIMQLHSVEAVVDPANAASIGLLQKTGFVREAFFRENFFFDGRFQDTAVYSLLAPVTAAQAANRTEPALVGAS